MTPSDENIYITLAPPDMWGRSQESGRRKADMFYDDGLQVTKSSNDREAGWLSIKELLADGPDGAPRLQIFDTCTRLINDLPSLIRDAKKPTDCSKEPHDITHVPDALRYFAIFWWRPGEKLDTRKTTVWTRDMYEDYVNASAEQKAYLIEKYGKPKNF